LPEYLREKHKETRIYAQEGELIMLDTEIDAIVTECHQEFARAAIIIRSLIVTPFKFGLEAQTHPEYGLDIPQFNEAHDLIRHALQRGQEIDAEYGSWKKDDVITTANELLYLLDHIDDRYPRVAWDANDRFKWAEVELNKEREEMESNSPISFQHFLLIAKLIAYDQQGASEEALEALDDVFQYFGIDELLVEYGMKEPTSESKSRTGIYTQELKDYISYLMKRNNPATLFGENMNTKEYRERMVGALHWAFLEGLEQYSSRPETTPERYLLNKLNRLPRDLLGEKQIKKPIETEQKFGDMVNSLRQKQQDPEKKLESEKDLPVKRQMIIDEVKKRIDPKSQDRKKQKMYAILEVIVDKKLKEEKITIDEIKEDPRIKGKMSRSTLGEHYNELMEIMGLS
jgi:hypothetical protein